MVKSSSDGWDQEVPEPGGILPLRIEFRRNALDTDMFIQNQVEDERQIRVVIRSETEFTRPNHPVTTRQNQGRQQHGPGHNDDE